MLAKNSVHSLKNHFLEQIEATPKKDEIVGYVEEIKQKVDKQIAVATEGEEDPNAEHQAPPTQPPPPPQPGPPVPGVRQTGEVKLDSCLKKDQLLTVPVHHRRTPLLNVTFHYLSLK